MSNHITNIILLNDNFKTTVKLLKNNSVDKSLLISDIHKIYDSYPNLENGNGNKNGYHKNTSICGKCFRTGHTTEYCGVKCHNCGILGHINIHCHKQKKNKNVNESINNEVVYESVHNDNDK